MALMSVLVLSVIGVAIISATLTLGANESRISAVISSALRAQALASACAEEALQVVKDAGTCVDVSSELTIDGQLCTYVATGGGGSTCEIYATSTVNDVSHQVNATVLSSETGLQLTFWSEVLN